MKTYIDVENMLDNKLPISDNICPDNCVLGIIVVGDSVSSEVYVRNKKRYLDKINLNMRIIRLKQDSTTNDVINEIYQLSLDENVSGIMVQLPLPQHIDENSVINAIPPEKDVEGITDKNLGRISIEKYSYFIPCTARGVIKILKNTGMLHDKTIAIIGRSKLVGKPLAFLLSGKKYNDTVMLCHYHTRNLHEICRTADVIISAVGKPNFITDKFIGKSGVLVIDIGTSIVNRKIVGDVDENSIGISYDVCLTPVPNGVGRLTLESLALNLIDAKRLQMGNN